MQLELLHEHESSPNYIVLDHFLGRGPDNDTPPFTDKADSVDVYFVVNMSNNLDFDPKTQKVHRSRMLQVETIGHGIVMNDIGDGYWSYHWRGAATTDLPITLNYKFTLGDSMKMA